MNYVFYFDETFHEEKITIKPNGTINALLEDKNNCYVGVFWGCKQEKLPEVIEPLIDLEKKYKKAFTLSDTKEFKSTTFSPKNFKYGICSFSQLILMHMAVFTGQQGRNFRTVRVIIGGQQAA